MHEREFYKLIEYQLIIQVKHRHVSISFCNADKNENDKWRCGQLYQFNKSSQKIKRANYNEFSKICKFVIP